MRVGKLLLLFAILLFVCCCTSTYTEYGQARPGKLFYFSMNKKPYVLKPYDAIDTTLVYCNEGDELALPEATSFRFFGNGRVHMMDTYAIYDSSGVKRVKDSLPINNLRQGTIGYYEIEDTNKLHIVLYYDTDRARYIHLRGIVQNGQFNFDKIFPDYRNHFRFNYVGKRPSDIKLFREDSLKGRPDW